MFVVIAIDRAKIRNVVVVVVVIIVVAVAISGTMS